MGCRKSVLSEKQPNKARFLKESTFFKESKERAFKRKKARLNEIKDV